MTAPAAHERPTEGVASTPPVLGYAVAIVVSWVAVSVSTGWAVFGLREGVLDPTWWVFVGMLGLVFGPFGALLVDAACDRFDAQWVHVVAAGLAGLLAATLVLAGDWPLVVAVGLSTALGRFAVTPLVPVVRLRAPAGASYWRRLTLR